MYVCKITCSEESIDCRVTFLEEPPEVIGVAAATTSTADGCYIGAASYIMTDMVLHARPKMSDKDAVK